MDMYFCVFVSSSLMDDFKSLLDRHKGSRFQIDEKWFEMPLSEIETPNSRRCSPSYRSLPENFPDLTCSGRTSFDAAFLNDQWISVPVGSEDFNFKNMTKNPHEFALFACEDERFEVDMVRARKVPRVHISTKNLSPHAHARAGLYFVRLNVTVRTEI